MTLPGDDIVFDCPPYDALECPSDYWLWVDDPLQGLTFHQPDEAPFFRGGGSGGGGYCDGTTKNMYDGEMKQQLLDKGKAPLVSDGGFPETKGQEATDSVKSSKIDYFVDDDAERRMLKGKMKVDGDYDKVGKVGGSEGPEPSCFRRAPIYQPRPGFLYADIERGQQDVGVGAPSHNNNRNRIDGVGAGCGVGNELVDRDRDKHRRQVLVTWASISIGIATAVVCTIELQKPVEKRNLRHSSLIEGLIILPAVSGFVSSLVGLGLIRHKQPSPSSFFIKLGAVATAASLILLSMTPFWGVLAWSIGAVLFLIASFFIFIA